MKNDLLNNFSFSSQNITVINNPISAKKNIVLDRNFSKEKVRFITVASLKKQKGHIRVLEVLSKLNFDFTYTIIGKGAEYENIYLKIKKLNLKKHVKYVPYTNQIDKYLSQNDFFLQGSYIEGFPNCLLESCAMGLPIIAYNSPGGLNEIIKKGFNGYLALDDSDFLNKLELAVSREWDRGKIKNDIYNRFGSEKIISEYETLFNKIIA